MPPCFGKIGSYIHGCCVFDRAGRYDDYIRDNYEMLCKDIYYGRINKKVKIPEEIRDSLKKQLVPNPKRAKQLMREFRLGFDTPIVPRIWPRMTWIAGEKTNEEALRWAVDNFSGHTGLEISDYSIYADPDVTPGRYTVLMEPARIVEADEIPRFRTLLEQLLMQANPIYGDLVRKGSMGELELVFVQQQTYRLYRDLMVMKGVSPNQLKPVRIIDTPFKKNFFFGFIEELK